MDKVINSFPGYEYKRFDDGTYHNMYRGTDVGRGGYVASIPGIYSDVALLDVQNMHGESITRLNKFGEHTKRFVEIRQARNAIKMRDFDKARTLLDGKLAKYLNDESNADQLSNALKLILNSAYGISAATFDNPLRDSRDVNNIIALRGALFMRTLQDEIINQGFVGIHYKTDSVKVPNATPEIIEFIMNFAKKYGYTFEHEATYERICLIDSANYVAAYASPEYCEKKYGYIPSDNSKHFKKNIYPWTTTGSAFQHPYIFKSLFSGEDITFQDRCEIKTVKDAAIYLDYNDIFESPESVENELIRREYNRSENGLKKPKKLNPLYSNYSDLYLKEYLSKGHDYSFVGRFGCFYPIKQGFGGGWLVALRNGKYNSVSGAKGYRWMEAEKVKLLHLEDEYDPKYFDNLLDEAIKSIEKFGSFERFVDIFRPYEAPPVKQDDLPWTVVPCGDNKYNTCMDCPDCKDDICKRGYSLASYIENGGE